MTGKGAAAPFCLPMTRRDHHPLHPPGSTARRRLLLAGAAGAMLPLPAWPADGAPGAAGLLLLLDDDGRRLAVVDAATLALLQRWPLSGAVRGDPLFTPDGRSVLLGTRDGRITRHEPPDGRPTATVDTGGELAAFALSSDGRWLLAAPAGTAGLALYDGDLRLVRRYPAASLDGRTSPVAAVFDAGARRSFVVAFDSLRELWEISYDRAAPPIFDGLVHDYRMGEAIASAGFLGVRRTPLETPFTALALDGSQRHVLGIAPATPALEVINLDVRRRIAQLAADVRSAAGLARFASQGRPMLAVAGADAMVRIVDAAPWRVVRALPLPAPAVVLRTHAAAPQLWAGSRVGAGEAIFTLVEKETLDIAGTVTLRGQLLGPTAFSADGQRLWVSMRRDGGDGLAVCSTGPPHDMRWLPTGRAPAAWPLP